MNYIYLILIVVLLVVCVVYMRNKNKKEVEGLKNLVDSIKKGHTVLTSSGVVGKVISFNEKDGFKTIVLETGDSKNKGYITFDINAVYANLSVQDIASVQGVAINKEDKTEEVAMEEKHEESTADVAVEEIVVEEKPAEKKSTSKKTSAKKPTAKKTSSKKSAK